MVVDVSAVPGSEHAVTPRAAEITMASPETEHRRIERHGCIWQLLPVTNPVSGKASILAQQTDALRRRGQRSEMSLQHVDRPGILNRMVQYAASDLDASFAALADGTRRGVLEQLGRGEASVTELAERFDMTLTGIRKHVGVLEDAGLVITEKVGRERRCRIGARRLDEVDAWIDSYHRLWDARFRDLDELLEHKLRNGEVG